MTAPNQRAKNWLQFAETDLEMAQELGKNQKFWGGAAYFCQQCAEKSLKALLIMEDLPEDRDFRTHNLRLLQQKAALFYPRAQELEKTVSSLFELDTAYRYPNDEYDTLPSQTEYQKAFKSASTVYKVATEIYESAAEAQRANQPTPE